MIQLHNAKVKYFTQCGNIKISDHIEGEDLKKVYIETERFEAESLYSPHKNFEEFEEDLIKLYEVTFGDPIVMEKYSNGKIKNKERFTEIVNIQSKRWEHGYPFGAFIIRDKEKIEENIVGYEVLGNAKSNDIFLPNFGELDYLFNKNYHRSAKIKNIGYECVGGLVIGYGAKQYAAQSLINQTYDKFLKQYTGGTIFKQIKAVTRTDNIGSIRILEKLGFANIDKITKCDVNRYVFNLNLEEYEANILGITTFNSSDQDS